MPRSRKRHHSRSRSRSRSHSRERSYEGHKKNDSYEKDGKRRRIDDTDSPQQKRSLRDRPSTSKEVHKIQDVNEQGTGTKNNRTIENYFKKEGGKRQNGAEAIKVTEILSVEVVDGKEYKESIAQHVKSEDEHSAQQDSADEKVSTSIKNKYTTLTESLDNSLSNAEEDNLKLEKMPLTDNEDDLLGHADSDPARFESKDERKDTFSTPRKPLTPKQIQKKLESEKRRQQKEKEREERERQKQEEKERILAEKQKIKQQKEEEKQRQLEEKQRQLEEKQKEKELKEEQKRKEREEKEQKRKEKEEKEEQKRKEKELEKLRRQQEIEEKNKEKQREEEKKQKSAALFVNFFKKTDGIQDEKKVDQINSNFMPFEVKSDMKLPPTRRAFLSSESLDKLDEYIKKQDETASYLRDLKSGAFIPRKSPQTWPYEDLEDDIVLIEQEKKLGETIYEDGSKVHKVRAKFLYFHSNRRPAYFGTWRKKSKFVKPRRPFGEDKDIFNYEEDSDDDWEEEEQGESLDISDGEGEKEVEDDKDDYEVDNEFFVPHGHLSDDEVDDEQNARLSPASLKQKLKLLKDEFELDIKSKTHKLKPRSIGCVWYNKQGDNIEDAIQRYLQPFAMIVRGQIEIKKRNEIFVPSPLKKKMKPIQELLPDQIPLFLKVIHGNVNKKKILIEQFFTYMANNGLNLEVSKPSLVKFLKEAATYKRCKEDGPMKNKFGWFVNAEFKEKYNINLDISVKDEH